MISQTVEYALRAIVTIAQHGGTPCTAQQLAATTQAPAPYLSKLMQSMVRAKLVTSKRGLHGGFVLTKDPSELTVWAVINAIEPLQRIRQCPLGLKSHQGTLCPLHRRLDDAMALVEEAFRETTIAELLAEPGSVTPLCEERTLVAIAPAPRSQNRSKRSPRKRKKANQSKG